MKNMEKLIRRIMKELVKRYDWAFNEEEMENTPKRIIGMLDEWKKENEYNKITMFENVYRYGNMIILRNMKLYAFCSHHLLPFFGNISVGYIPKKDEKIYGASKIERMIRKYAYKSQIQEKMTEEIADEIYGDGKYIEGVIVVIKATHLCMVMRGVKDRGVSMITSSVRGAFKNGNARMEFLELVK